MKQPFLTINDNENLEISDMDTDSVPVEFDINADFDGSIRKFANFMFDNNISNISNMACSSSIHFSDEYGIEKMMLDSFFDSFRDMRFINVG